IAAEGDKTEYFYFQKLIQQYSLQLNKRNIKLKYLDRDKDKSGESAPQHIREKLRELYNSLGDQYNIQEYDEFWMIIDTDDYNNHKEEIQESINLCEINQNFKMGLSNPCFDLWLILHFVDTDTQWEESNNCQKSKTNKNSQKSKTNKKRKVKQPTIREDIENEGIRGRPQLCKEILHKIHPNKSKSNYYKEFIKGKYLVAAIERARKLGDCHPTDKDFPQRIG
ncbi:RloB family protein, partial [Planktothrix sp.]|uniref:RloB family protein n=1 Tax=Planktothrix sp. TaxID=3088171 RepID=UPI0038D3C1F6